jgi:hypothetical protein
MAKKKKKRPPRVYKKGEKLYIKEGKQKVPISDVQLVINNYISKNSRKGKKRGPEATADLKAKQLEQASQAKQLLQMQEAIKENKQRAEMDLRVKQIREEALAKNNLELQALKLNHDRQMYELKQQLDAQERVQGVAVNDITRQLVERQALIDNYDKRVDQLLESKNENIENLYGNISDLKLAEQARLEKNKLAAYRKASNEEHKRSIEVAKMEIDRLLAKPPGYDASPAAAAEYDKKLEAAQRELSLRQQSKPGIPLEAQSTQVYVDDGGPSVMAQSAQVSVMAQPTAPLLDRPSIEDTVAPRLMQRRQDIMAAAPRPEAEGPRAITVELDGEFKDSGPPTAAPKPVGPNPEQGSKGLSKLNYTIQHGLGNSKGVSSLPNGLTNVQIDDIMDVFPQYIKTICSDEIIDIIPACKTTLDEYGQFGFIINLDKQNTTDYLHWCAVYCESDDEKVLYWYDPFGHPPLKHIVTDLKKLVHEMSLPYYLGTGINTKKNQNLNSNRCGIHCMLFLTDMFNGMSTEDASSHNEHDAMDFQARYI